MKHNIELLKADINDELEKINCLEKEFNKIRDKINQEAEEIGYYDRGAITFVKT